jgi:hypothetical protein
MVAINPQLYIIPPSTVLLHILELFVFFSASCQQSNYGYFNNFTPRRDPLRAAVHYFFFVK